MLLRQVSFLTYEKGWAGYFNGRIPDIRPICYAGYPAYNQISGWITGYLGRKQTFCHKIFGTIPYYALGAKITAPNFGFLKK